jgi:uncharacterized protein (DUF2164 family)
MQSDNTRKHDDTLKVVGQIFENIGWETRLCDLDKEQVLGIVAKMQSMRDLENEYTEQGILESQQKVETKLRDFSDDDYIPF